MWISHEHPDHFHIPTLKAIKSYLKEDIVIVYQVLFGDKVPKFLKKFGFHNIMLLKHGKTEVLKKSNVRLTIFQVGTMDSALLIQDEKYNILINNDCELSDKDFQLISSYYSKLDLLMSQFSIAKFDILDKTILKENLLKSLILFNYSKMLCLAIQYQHPFIFVLRTINFLTNLNNIEDVQNLFTKNKTKCTLLLFIKFDLSDPTSQQCERIEEFKKIKNQHDTAYKIKEN